MTFKTWVWRQKVHAIANIIKGDWLNFDAWLAANKPTVTDGTG